MDAYRQNQPWPLSKLKESLFFTLCVAMFFSIGHAAPGMIYRPKTGVLWDPSIIWHDGSYYAFVMYDKDGRGFGHCFLASSTDGVHWKDEGTILEERDRAQGSQFYKCFVGRCGDRFIMDHGVLRQAGQDTLRFYQSNDLRNWTYIASTQPDLRWYVRPGRWDHMYVLPKEEANPSGGFWGYVVAVPRNGVDLPAMMESADGLKWDVLPPARTEWGRTPPRNHFEYGGCERIGTRYYLIGGAHEYISQGYSTYTLTADHPRGPFRPDAEAYRLCGSSTKAAGLGVQLLAGWARAKGELLISNSACVPSGVWLLPLRKPVLDANGHLHLGWWKRNEAIKGKKLDLKKNEIALSKKATIGYEIRWLDDVFDLQKGIVLEGTVRATAPDGEGEHRTGFVLDEGSNQVMAIQLGIGKADGRETHIGRLKTQAGGTTMFHCEDVTGKGCATVTGMESDRSHTFRLLLRADLFELYIDDLLMQTYVYRPISGRIGIFVRNADVVFRNLTAWTMDF